MLIFKTLVFIFNTFLPTWFLFKGLSRWLSDKESIKAGDTGSILGSGVSLEEEMTTHFSVLALEIPWTAEPWQATVHGVAESDTTEHLPTFFFKLKKLSETDKYMLFIDINY